MTTRRVLVLAMLVSVAGCWHHGPISEAKPAQSLAEVLTDIPNPDMVRILRCGDGHEWIRVNRSMRGDEQLDAIWETTSGALVWEKDRKYLGGVCFCAPAVVAHTWGAPPAKAAGCGDWVRDDGELAKLKARFTATTPGAAH